MLKRMRGSLIFEMIITSVLEQVFARTDNGEIKRVPMQSAIKPSITRTITGNILRTSLALRFASTVYFHKMLASFSTASTQRGTERT